MRKISEQDFKKFHKSFPELRERYIKDINQKIIDIFNDKNKDETEKFWLAEEMIDEQSKILRRCLDGISRSRAFLYVMNMWYVGMLTGEDLKGYSPEFQQMVLELDNQS
ncbi:MAG: hypothetical protein JEZ07_02125 [Phycisphaerae bacterium]|nr:hypothetical protein [Phycisphaerae bacterium]